MFKNIRSDYVIVFGIFVFIGILSVFEKYQVFAKMMSL